MKAYVCPLSSSNATGYAVSAAVVTADSYEEALGRAVKIALQKWPDNPITVEAYPIERTKIEFWYENCKED